MKKGLTRCQFPPSNHGMVTCVGWVRDKREGSPPNNIQWLHDRSPRWNIICKSCIKHPKIMEDISIQSMLTHSMWVMKQLVEGSSKDVNPQIMCKMPLNEWIRRVLNNIGCDMSWEDQCMYIYPQVSWDMWLVPRDPWTASIFLMPYLR